jgi:hypothetical protein
MYSCIDKIADGILLRRIWVRSKQFRADPQHLVPASLAAHRDIIRF